MDEQKLQDFLIWLPTKFEEFQNKTPDETVEILNNMSQTDEGKQQIESMWMSFVQESQPQQTPPQSAGMFKDGGKLDAFVDKYKKGGKSNSAKGKTKSYGKKRCKCGCEMIEVKENGGTIERCACGCEIKKHQSGGTNTSENTIPFQKKNLLQRTWLKTLGTTDKTEFVDWKGQGNAYQVGNDKTVWRTIERPVGWDPTSTNRTTQVITNYNTPKADTLYFAPRGTRFTNQTAPSYREAFDRIFGTNPIIRPR